MKKLTLICIILITAISCSKKEQGCTDTTASNFSTLAEEDDGSCTYKGRITFYTTKCSSVDVSEGKITIYVNGNYFWDLNNCFPAAGCSDACGCSAGVSSFDGGASSYYSTGVFQSYGTYNYTAYDKDSTNSWSGSYIVDSKDGVCIDLN